MNNKIKIVFFGTPQIAAQVLENCIQDERFEVCAVVSQADKPAGRGRSIKSTPVKQVALDQNIPCHQPKKIKGNAQFLETLEAYQADYFLVIAYGRIVPQSILDMPTYGCLNIHGSLLPKYRGAAPIQYALLNGENITGPTLMYMDAKMDEGDVIDTLEFPISPFETSGTLFEKFSQRSGPFALDMMADLIHNPRRTHQNHDIATYTRMITKEDGVLNFTLSAKENFHRWQAYTPWPGIAHELYGKTIKIESCMAIQHTCGDYKYIQRIDKNHLSESELTLLESQF